MNLKDKRTRRITAACASAAVVTAGGVAFGIGASANGSLSLSTVTSFSTVNLGKQIPVSVQTLTTGAALGGAETFTVTALGQPTAALAKDTTSAQLETALNALSNVAAAGGLTVTDSGAGSDYQTSGHAFVVRFNVPGARAAITVADTHAGNPNVTVAQTTTGTVALPQAALANATFGTKVSSSVTGHLGITLDSYTAPSGVTVTGKPTLMYNHGQASGLATGPTAAWGSLYSTSSATTSSADLGAIAGPDANDTFFTANLPGTYTFHFTDDNNTAGTGDDAVSPTVTMAVLDAQAATAATSDDWSPTVAMSKSSADIGASLIASVPFAALTGGDTRASSGGVGILASKLAALVGVGFTGTPTGGGTLGADLTAAGVNAGAAVTAGATAGTRTLAAGVAAHAGTVTGTAFFDRNGDGTISDALGTAGTTTIQSNGVSAVLLEPVEQSSKVASGLVLTAGNVVVKTNGALAATGTAITLSAASGTDLTNHRIKISKTGETSEIVTVTAGGTTTGLTTTALQYAHSTGSTVTDLSAVNVHNGTTAVTYTATVTDSDSDKSGNIVYFTLGGTDVASLTTNGTAAGTNVYSATTNSDGVASITVTDGAATPVSYTVTSASNNISNGPLTVKYGDPRASIVAITTTGAALSPTVSAGQVTINGKLLDQFGANYAPAQSLNQQIDVSGAVTAHPVLSGGTFSYLYKPVATPTAGSTDTLNFASTGEGNPAAAAVVSWASSTPVSAVTVVPASTTPAVAKVTPFATPVAITGKVTDSGASGLAYKTVTLTGTQGVYFSTASTGANLVNTLDVATDSSGNYTVYAVFTRSGLGKVTATSEGKSASADVTVGVAANTESFTLNVTSQSTMPNSTVVISGRVNDVFGNPVENATVTIVPDDITYGVLSSSTATTNASGDYSVIFTTGSKTGKVFLSAKVALGATITPHASWLAIGGLTLPKSNTVATGNITIAADAVSLSASKTTLVGGGNLTLKGNTRHGAVVDVYWKTSGGPAQFIDSVTADGSGDFSVPARVTASGYFFAKTSTATSQAVSVKVVSTAKISARSLGSGWVRVSVSGGPSKAGTVVLWERLRGGKLVKRAVVHTSTGAASWKIRAGKGAKIYRATYTASGAAISGIVSVSVTVK
jgi:hypothetical protein